MPANFREIRVYRPKTEYEKKIFPNLGTARVTGGIPCYIGRVGTIIQEDDEVARIAFDEFWDRSTDEIRGNTWAFTGEYERINDVTV
jgi:hypothetical protein